jgi:hypothetical protein
MVGRAECLVYVSHARDGLSLSLLLHYIDQIVVALVPHTWAAQ